MAKGSGNRRRSVDPEAPVDGRYGVAMLQTKGRLQLPPAATTGLSWAPGSALLVLGQRVGHAQLAAFDPYGETLKRARQRLSQARDIGAGADGLRLFDQKYRPITIQPDGRLRLDDDVLFYLDELREGRQVLVVRRKQAIHLYSLSRHATMLREIEDLIPEDG